MNIKKWKQICVSTMLAIALTAASGIGSMQAAASEIAEEQPILYTAEEDSVSESEGEPAAEAALIEMEDGEYAISVALEGGSGKSTVTSPAIMSVVDGRAYVRLIWSSSYYDYMIVGGQKYLPVNDEGNSVFEIPILVFNDPMPVIADTTAMSTPHEVAYTLTFDVESITDKSATPQAAAQRVVYMVVAIIAFCIVVSFINKKRRKR